MGISMQPHSKLSYAIAAILGGGAFGSAVAANSTDANSASDQIQEIIVTAQRRTENVQNVAIAIQALTGETLKQLNVTTFDDLIKFLPNVTAPTAGPGQAQIFMRGLSAGSNGTQSGGSINGFPNVAIYLDEQSGQLPGRNLDVYAADLERIEVLEGPQGTLFGGGAQAGAIRYITNKPKLDVTEGSVTAGYGITASGGDPNSNLNAVLNLPVIADTLAVRAGIFSDHRGGYISNVPATIAFVPGSTPAVSGGNPTANNYNVLQTNSNPINVQGFRLSGLYKINDDWNLLIQQNYQDMRADGYSYAYPVATDGAALAHNQITAFPPAYNKDRHESTAWTLSGKIGDLKAVYAGSYMVRHIDEQQDYSNYVRSANAAYYYGCIGAPGALFGPAYYPQLAGHKLQCYAPVGNWHDSVQNKHQSHELRVTTNEDYRLRGLVGAYWEKFVIDDQVDLNYMSIPQCNPANLAAALAGGPDCVSAVGPLPGAFATNPSLRTNLNNAFGVDSQRGYTQTAFFASVDFDIIPKVLT